MHIRSRLHQPSDTRSVPANDRPVKGRKASIVLRMCTGPVLQQELHGKCIALVCRPHQRRMALRIPCVDVDGLVQEVKQGDDRRRVRNEVEGVVALRIGDVRVRVVGDEQLDHVQVPVARRPLHRRCDEVAPKRIDLRTLLQEKAARCNLCVNGSPVERCNVLLVTVRCMRLARLDEVPERLNVAPLGGHKDIGLLENARFWIFRTRRRRAIRYSLLILRLSGERELGGRSSWLPTP